MLYTLASWRDLENLSLRKKKEKREEKRKEKKVNTCGKMRQQFLQIFLAIASPIVTWLPVAWDFALILSSLIR